jgi:hypothetical protein
MREYHESILFLQHISNGLLEMNYIMLGIHLKIINKRTLPCLLADYAVAVYNFVDM